VKSAERVSSRPRVAPPVDVYEDEKEFLLYADLPGVDRKDLTIRLERSELTLTARRAALRESRVEPPAEFDYVRSFVLPTGIDGTRVDAELKDGVLVVHLPKHASLQPRQIPIKTA
jgi:HSP20 family molecular chaperone IbpA